MTKKRIMTQEKSYKEKRELVRNFRELIKIVKEQEEDGKDD